MDYRLKENRRTAFKRWYAWSLKYEDCDPAVWATNYLNKRYEHNDEQKLWFCWLYGNTYNLPTAWVLMNEFPDFELATVDRITKWNTENYTKLRYQTDTKWNKGHLPVMFESYKKFIGDKTQREVVSSYYGNTREESFNSLWDNVKTDLHKFGRYSTWFYLQHLKHTADVLIEPTSLMLDDYNGSLSHRNGLLLALGEDDKYDAKLATSDYIRLQRESDSILSELRHEFPELKDKLDYFTMETALCSFKKIFRKSNGRYLGYYLDRQSEEILKASSDGWYGIDWDVMWQARAETLNRDLITPNKKQVDKSKYSSFLNSGSISGLETMFNDEPLNGLESFFV